MNADFWSCESDWRSPNSKSMKTPISLLLGSALAATGLAADTTFYIGTYTKPGKSKGVYVSKLNTDTGKLGPVELAGEAKSPSFVALSPGNNFLYASIEAGGGAVQAFAVKPDGKLTALNQQSTGVMARVTCGSMPRETMCSPR